MKLFAPFESPKLTIKNRVVMAPMTRSQSPGGISTDKVIEYYRQRAAGGVGLIITEGTNISEPSSQGYPDVPVLYGDALKSWEKIVKAVHAEGGKIAPQIWHVGALRSPQFDPKNNIESLSPSGVYYLDQKKNHNPGTMTNQEVKRTIQSFAEAAYNAKEIGFDAIELHGAHGYLIDQFGWAETNQRDDEYGQDRSLFAREILHEIRNKIGQDFPIIFRFSNWKLGKYENCHFKNPEELNLFLQPLVDSGVDIFHCSSRNFAKPEFTESSLNLAGWTKKLTNLPVISVGSVGLESDFIRTFQEATKQNSLETLHEKLEAEEFDLIAVGRSLISDPEWANKVREGRIEEVVPFDKSFLSEL